MNTEQTAVVDTNHISLEALLSRLEEFKKLGTVSSKDDEDELEDEEMKFLFNAVQFMISNRLKKKDTEKVKQLVQAISNPTQKEGKNVTPFIFPLSQSRKLQKNISKNFGAQVLTTVVSMPSSSSKKSKEDTSISKRSPKKVQEETDEELDKSVQDSISSVGYQPNSANIYHVHTPKKVEVDIHELYQQAVQSAKDDVYLFEKIFRTYFQQKAPHVFREDFCGTGLLCCEWAKRSVENVSIGVDLDFDTLEWGKNNNIEKKYSKYNVRDRVFSFCKNVLDFDWDNTLKDCEILKAESETNVSILRKADIICAYNYSVSLLHKRKELITYFKEVRKSMADDGSIFLFDVFGGSKMMSTDNKEYIRKDLPGGVLYEFEQTNYNPITEIVTCYIHFR